MWVGDGRCHLQPLGVLVLWSSCDLIRVTDLNDLALVDHRNSVADVMDNTKVVTDK